VFGEYWSNDHALTFNGGTRFSLTTPCSRVCDNLWQWPGVCNDDSSLEAAGRARSGRASVALGGCPKGRRVLRSWLLCSLTEALTPRKPFELPMRKYVVSRTLDRVDWNAELVRGDLERAVQQLEQESVKGLFVGGVTLPMALAELGWIDEYEFVVHSRAAGASQRASAKSVPDRR
jgi:hypothetical protein